MTRRPGDTTPEPPGGRAAERLRMFQEARGQTGAARDKKPAPSGKSGKPARASKRGGKANAKQDRRST